MLVGVPKEGKVREARVGLVPNSVAELTIVAMVLVETNAGAGVGAGDEAYRAAGAESAPDANTVFDRAEMIVKVKEPQPVSGFSYRNIRSVHISASCCRPSADTRQWSLAVPRLPMRRSPTIRVACRFWLR